MRFRKEAIGEIKNMYDSNQSNLELYGLTLKMDRINTDNVTESVTQKRKKGANYEHNNNMES